ncbi:lipocalin-like domain-containing protein [Caulobacter soli]|uniref:lipocalin-like domain-containing protein n=1 Tax=Caulobacter soli TaxID=2708539 RepID=UPI0013ED90C9|nr:lipocalin-like domain-containing protein [Caulobacter soli]
MSLSIPQRGRGASRALAASQGIQPKAADGPIPVPAALSGIHMPADHYMHRGAPTEWWWNIGTLTCGDRIFGFEINAAAFRDRNFAFSQIMLSDVANQKHYQRTTSYIPPAGVDFDTWAQSDPTRDWHVGLGRIDNQLSTIDVVTGGSGYDDKTTVVVSGGGGSQAIAYPIVVGGVVTAIQLTNPGRGYTSRPTVTVVGKGSGATAKAVHSYVTMDAAWGDPTKNIAIVAKLNDRVTGTEALFDLMLSQEGSPFIVWGVGVGPIKPPASGPPLQTNNFYYSLTNLKAAGTITLDGEVHAVTGVTWMDHEYGFFGTAASPTKWLLQDAQLSNGWTLSNFCVLPGTASPPEGKPSASFVTLRDPSGQMYVHPSTMTPTVKWISPHTGVEYFLQYEVKIGDFADLTVKSLLPDQEFVLDTGSVYEGVASVTGTFKGAAVSGTGWIEQAI